MRRNQQLIVSPTHGDCFRACMTSLLGIPNDPALPDSGDPEWFTKWWNFVAQFGFEICCRASGFWVTGHWIASVPSLNYEGATHAIVMNGSEVAFDPTTSVKAYTAGESLLGKDVVRQGTFLVLSDASKLEALVELQRAARP